ncbi:MAG: hypothetical protein ACLKAK_07155 [Alkaliphilus sp.]
MKKILMKLNEREEDFLKQYAEVFKEERRNDITADPEERSVT